MDQAQTNAEQPISRANMTDEEKKRLKEEKKAKKEAEKRLKAERKKEAAEKAAAALAESQALTQGIEYLTINKEPISSYGSYRIIQSKCSADGSGRVFVPLSNLAEKKLGETLWVRARLQKRVFASKVSFFTLRRGLDTVQAVTTNMDLIKWARKVASTESIVDIFAEITKPESGNVESCSIGNVELNIKKLYVVSRADDTLPMTLEDAMRPAAEDDEEENVNEGEKTRPRVTRTSRLDARVVDIRAPPHASLMRVQAAVCQLFREALIEKGFIEIHSPKLIAGASEGGSDVFKFKYFGHDACLAQSPQLYKQMAICGDMQRVFEIGPVFRAEKSHTHRHLCEFTGLDLEMEIFEHYNEILDVLDNLFSKIFDGLEKRFSKELATVRAKWNIPVFKHYSGKPNLRLKWPEAITLLRQAGVEIGDFDDINTEQEKLLGRLIHEKYDTDFYILTHFPSNIRPFYTMVNPNDNKYSNSFDLFMRGEEIVSGAQRIHDVDLLKVRATAMLGEDGVKAINDYIESFKYGAPPHGGAGIGLERVVMLYLGINNVRECSLFPRDPDRLTP